MTAASNHFLQRVATGSLTTALSWCHEFGRRRYSEVHHFAIQGQRKKLRRVLWQTLNSDVVKISCLHRAGFRSDDPLAYLNAAGDIDLGASYEGEVAWYNIPKTDGGVRKIVNLPNKLKARHKMIASLIDARFKPPEFLYGVRGRGRDSLIGDMLTLLNDGFTEVIRCDIADCFENINPKALTMLPLSEGVIKNAMSPASLRLVMKARLEDTAGNPGNAPYGASEGTYMENSNVVGPNGLMQGSPASNIALAYLLRGLKWPNSKNVVVFIYCDDFFIVGKTMEDCRVVEDALADYLARCSFGPLTLSRKETSETGYFEALGYGIARCPIDGIWSADLSVRNHDKLEALYEAAVKEDELAGFLLPHKADALLKKRMKSFAGASKKEAIKARYHDSGADSLNANLNALRARVRMDGEARGLSEDAIEFAVEAALRHEAEISRR